MITWNKPVLTYTYNQETLSITPWGNNAFRVQAIKQAHFPEERWALTQPVQSTATAKEEGDGWTITNGKLSCARRERRRTAPPRRGARTRRT